MLKLKKVRKTNDKLTFIRESCNKRVEFGHIRCVDDRFFGEEIHVELGGKIVEDPRHMIRIVHNVWNRLNIRDELLKQQT
jgi:hypothetical protein